MQLIRILEGVKASEGNVDVFAAGHPGEVGSQIAAAGFEIVDRSDVGGQSRSKKVLRINV